jgi:hypothetical protein
MMARSLCLRAVVLFTTPASALLALALLASACGGPSTPRVGTGTAGAERPPYVPCENPAEVRLAPHVCWNPAGSRWHVTAQAPGGALTFDIELMAGGRVRSTDDAAGGPGTDEWFVQEDILRIFLSNRYVEYRGHLTNGTVLVGDVMNVRGDMWDFRADRIHGGGCAEGELTLGEAGDPVCYSAAGSRWIVSARGATYTVELGAAGALRSDNPSDTTVGNDTWVQAGRELRLRFDEGATEYTATLGTALDRLEGSARDASGTFTFTAQAVVTHAPPFH